MAAASITTRYDASKKKTYAAGTFGFDNTDVNLTISVADTSTLLSGGVSFNSLSLQKPGSFSIECDIPDKDVKFRFMNSFRVLNKPVNLSYAHRRADNMTALGGTVGLNSDNTLSGSYDVGSGNSKIKYKYSHNGLTTIEPGYNFGQNAWKLAVSQKFNGDNAVRASYKSDKKVLGFDFMRNSGEDGNFKVSASFDLEDKLKFPRVTAQSTWSINM